MAVVMGAGGLPPRAARRQEALEYRLVYLAGFVVFLAAAVVARLLPAGQRRRSPGRDRSIVGEARAAADTFIPFAFMG